VTFQDGAFQPSFQSEGGSVVQRSYGGAFDDGQSWREYVEAEFRAKHIQKELVKQEKQLKTVVKQIKTSEKKVKQERAEGILANLHRLEFRKDEIQHKIEALRQELIPLEWFLEADADEDDEEVMLLDS
jgi:predicted ribosome quality control (RQC) complex YloA/Tae2 family protein